MDPARNLQPALWGGVFIGVLSSLPIVGWINACCCLWVVSGGVLALWLTQSNQPQPVTAADGALVGLLAGAFGGLIAIPLNLAMEQWQKDLFLGLLDRAQVEIPPEVRALLERRSMALISIASGLFTAVVYAIFAMLGGLLGVALFKKKDLPPPPGTIEILPPA
jgi:hypothetical protein